MEDLSEGKWNLAFQPQQKSYLHYHNAYGHQTWQDGDLPWDAPISEISRDPLIMWSCESRDKLKPLSLHYQSSYSQRTLQNGNLV